MYAIAEVLHKCVYEVEQMSTSEYFGWLSFYEEKQRQREADNGNLLAMDPDNMVGALTGEG